MAKKKRGAQQHRWEREEEGILLAWLDHTIAHREVDFESTIVTRLNSVYTIAQINRKLAGLWKSYGPHHEERKPGIWVSDLNTYGSECLKRTNHMEYGLPQEVLKELTTWTMLFEEEYASKQLLQPSRKLRSQSRSNDFSPARRTGLNSPKPPIQTSQTPRQRTQTYSLTPAAIKREIESPPGKKSPAKKTKYKPSQNIRSPNIAFAKSPNRTPRPQMNTRHGRAGRHRKPSISVINDSEEELDNHLGRREAADDDNEIPTRCICGATEDIPPPVERENPYSPHEWILCSRCNIWQHILCVIYCFNDVTLPENYFCERCEPEFHRNRQPNQSSSHITDSVSVNLRGSRSATAPIEEELNHLQSVDKNILTSLAGETPSTMLPGQSTAREKISDLEEEIWQLKLELEVRDTTITGLEREVSCLKESQKQRDAQTGVPVEKLMTENLKQERSLYANLRARQEGAKFAKLAATSREWFGHIKTDHGFYDIYSESRQILCQRDCENWEFTPSLVGHDKLQNLVSKCLSVELRTPEQMDEAMKILLRFTPDEVVRALATCALLLWVFETDFPQFDKESSEFLTKYRELLATQDGAVALRNIDLAARASLTRSMAFQAREIPETAKSLAIKLSQTLAPLFSQMPEAREEVDWDGFATWHDDIEEWSGRRKRFEDMFKAALRMKADSCLNTEDYEMVIYPPGTKFNQKTMETQAIAGKNSASTQVGRAIGLCIEAAVFSHARKELDQNATVLEATATSHNFLRREEKDRAQSLPIVKAVVVLVEK